MKLLYVTSALLAWIVLGCSKNAGPPPPLALEQIPAAFDKAFAKAKPEVKAMANQVISSVQTNGYSQAYSQLQTLGAAPNLTKEQSSVIGRATLTINSLMQAAAAKGDEHAAEAVHVYRSNK